MFHRYALALRPLIEVALDDPHATLVQFLPRAVDVFRAVQSLSGAVATMPPCGSVGIQDVFIFGPKIKSLWDRATKLNVNVWGRIHEPASYAVLANARENDLVIILITQEDLQHGMPSAVSSLLPIPAAEIQRRFEAGQSVQTEANRNGWTIVLLAARDNAALDVVVQGSPILSKFLPQ
jgi:hypothetical protein